jgi:hypothetical protein
MNQPSTLHQLYSSGYYCHTGDRMNTTKIMNELRTERKRIDQAIAALESLDGTATATTPAAKAAPKRGGRRRMSAAGRKHISEAAKARWAARRKQAGKPATNKTGARKPMSAATKKRLSLLAKRRWAAQKKAAKAS